MLLGSTAKAKLQNDIDATAKLVEQKERELAGPRSDLDKRSELVTSTISNIEVCIDHRRAVMNVFAEALDKVRNEEEVDIKPLARTLRDRFEAKKPTHEYAITEKEDAKNNCKSEIP